MTGTKTNEREGTRAVHRHARVSAFKARSVLDLIRGRSLDQAYETLEFSERGPARLILKVLDSAAANAANNDGIPAEELYVSACYADEGPTLKRWRPRARGRATRIRKRTCHITVIVSRYDETELARRRARAEARTSRGTSTATEARRRRVERSKRRQAAEGSETSTEDAEELVDEADAALEDVESQVSQEVEEAVEEAAADDAADAAGDAAEESGEKAEIAAEVAADEAEQVDEAGRPEGDES